MAQVRVRRIQIFPLFEDYDRVHIGSVTRSQVQSSLQHTGITLCHCMFHEFSVDIYYYDDI